MICFRRCRTKKWTSWSANTAPSTRPAITSQPNYTQTCSRLSRLPGRKSTATTKGTPTTRIVLEKFGLLPYFDHVQGTDGFPSKPQPDVIYKSSGSARSEAGGMPADRRRRSRLEAGRRAGVKTCGVRYGYGDPAKMAEWQPDYWIDDISELLPG